MRTAGTIRSLICMVVLVAFSFQSFLVQTHMHGLSLNTAGPVPTVSVSKDIKSPIDTDKCYLCQEFLHAGTYVTPQVAAVLPPSAAVSLLPLMLAPRALAHIVSHNWMGRAPPRA